MERRKVADPNKTHTHTQCS